MARARNIKPAFFANEELAELPFEARLLFIGLWTLADREGRLEDRPKRIKMAVFPADNIDVEPSLDGLHRGGLIERYTIDGVSVIQIPKFVQHQRPHGAEKDSELPCIDGLYIQHERGRTGLVTNAEKYTSYTKQQLTEKKHCAKTVSAHTKTVLAPYRHALNPECGILNAESLILNPEYGMLHPEVNTIPHQQAGAPTQKPKAKSTPAKIQKPEGVEQGVWDDWLQLRNRKGASVTSTVVSGAEKEAAKAGMSLNDFFAEWCLRGSQGLKAEWLVNTGKGQKPQGGTINGVGVSAVGMQNYEVMQRYLAKKAAQVVDMEGQ